MHSDSNSTETLTSSNAPSGPSGLTDPSNPSDKKLRLLFVRLDRIGDLVLTLPVDQALSTHDIHWWIPQGLSFVTQFASPRRQTTEFAQKTNFSKFFQDLRCLRRQRFDAAVVFHAPWWVGALIWLARIPIRVGVRSQWHSFLFFNRSVRQRRSQAECNELEYNHRLLESGLNLNIGSLRRNSLNLTGWVGLERQSFLMKHNLHDRKFVVVHPGMGGSARNWPAENYAALILEFLKNGQSVAITGTPADEPYLSPIRQLLSEAPTDQKIDQKIEEKTLAQESGGFGPATRQPLRQTTRQTTHQTPHETLTQGKSEIVWLDGKLTGPELITLLASAQAIVAPSTGVLHLAASTGQPVIGLFSPVRVQKPSRWGPQGSRVRTLVPDVNCPAVHSCLGSQCSEFDCMRKIQIADVLGTLSDI